MRWLLPGALFGALALVRPEYLGVAVLLAAIVIASRSARATGAPPFYVLLFSSARLVVVIAPWTVRNAVALDRFVPISTGGGQVLFAGTYLPSDGDPEKVGAEVVRRKPAAVRARGRAAAAPRADPRSAGARPATPEWKPTRRSRRWARNSSGTTSPNEPLEYAGFVADQGRPHLVARAAGRDARAGLGGPALGAGRPRPARPRDARLAAPLGGAAVRRRSSSRSPRSAPCSSPRPAASWCCVPLSPPSPASAIALARCAGDLAEVRGCASTRIA